MKTKVLCVVCIAIVSIPWVAAAAECPVEKFTIQDVERLKFSESLTLAVIDTMEQSQQNKDAKDFNLGVVIKGVPVNVGFKEMKDVSNFVKKNSSFNFSRDQQIDYLRTNLSLVGAQMYADCLKRRTQNFSIEVPTTAYTDDEFLVKIRWTPTYPLDGKTDAEATLTVLNGTADGAQTSNKQVKDKKIVAFVVQRSDRAKSLQLIPSVDGIDNGEDTGILIPPIVSSNFTTVLRTWPPEGTQPLAPVCSDDGGGNCGNDEKHFVRCIYASANGMLLPSTAKIEANNRNGFANVTPTSDYSSVCMDFGTWGVNRIGKKGYSAISDVKLFVREIVPQPQVLQMQQAKQ
jgi:hypothetical protein